MHAQVSAGKSALLIAPTGGGKTLAGFLPSLVELSQGAAGKGLHTLYVSPLKALAVDIARNLETPALGTGTDAELFGTFTLFHRFVLQPSIQYSDLYTQADGEEVFKGFVLRARANLQFSRELQ